MTDFGGSALVRTTRKGKSTGNTDKGLRANQSEIFDWFRNLSEKRLGSSEILVADFLQVNKCLKEFVKLQKD